MARTVVLAAVLLLAGAGAQAQPLSLAIRDGRVSLEATNVPVQQLLAEWSRIGGTRVVGAEQLTGPPLTLSLADVPEREALDIILRGAAGYVAAPRSASGTGASAFDRIVVMASSTSAGSARRAGAAAAPPVPIQQPEPEPDPDPPAMPSMEDVNPFAAVPPEDSPFGQPVMPGTVNPFSQPNPSAQMTPFGQPMTPVQGGAQPLIFKPVQPGGSPNPFEAPGAPPAAAPVFVPFGSPTPGVVTQPPPQPSRPPGA